MVDVNIRWLTQKDIEAELRDYEVRYAMTSADFYEKFSQGEMGDSADVMEWATMYEWSLEPSKKHRRVKA